NSPYIGSEQKCCPTFSRGKCRAIREGEVVRPCVTVHGGTANMPRYLVSKEAHERAKATWDAQIKNLQEECDERNKANDPDSYFWMIRYFLRDPDIMEVYRTCLSAEERAHIEGWRGRKIKGRARKPAAGESSLTWPPVATLSF